ncbi:protein RGF1 INDUCIBLE TRANSCRIPTION FACTOR 1 [Lotus japonicus]|uniref:protein RGF1 INDUCIBLE TRANSCRIPTION FACTOR 1 n=1 Tax=Lotus japonicus TaxID=34305 RepID=UPI00258CC9CE|nr:protein RGF1 INDUCIBLE TRANSCRIPTION FACTOR 1 [Lotus japonicus]
MFISSPNVPRWLQVLLTEKFYNACIIHEEARKNEKNVYCLDCCISLCPHCLDPHRSHRLLQIRRYVYNDVIKLDDATKLIDCTLVQSYTTNSAKVVFLHERPHPKNNSLRGSGNFCTTCDRSLQDPYQFCSLSCKINHLVKTAAGSISGHLFECNYMALPETGSDDGLMTPDTVLEPAGSARTSSGSGGYGGAVVDCMAALACTATTEVVRKKRTSCSTFRPPCRPACSPVSEMAEISAALMNRRKGNPQRAPLY